MKNCPIPGIAYAKSSEFTVFVDSASIRKGLQFK